MSRRRSRWVELVDTRSDGEEVLFPFRIRAEIRGARVRTQCFIRFSDKWELYRTWPWQGHTHGPHVDLLELDRLAIKVADTFRDWLLEHEQAEYQTILEKAEVITGWERETGFVNGDDLVPSTA